MQNDVNWQTFTLPQSQMLTASLSSLTPIQDIVKGDFKRLFLPHVQTFSMVTLQVCLVLKADLSAEKSLLGIGY